MKSRKSVNRHMSSMKKEIIMSEEMNEVVQSEEKVILEIEEV